MLTAKSKNSAENCLRTLGMTPVFMRDFDGTIRRWSRGAQQLYGWPAERAVGRVSHEVLRTEFPKPLDEINAELAAKGWWSGPLRHYRQDDSPVFVASFWSRADGERNLIVETAVESNRDAGSIMDDSSKIQRVSDDLEQFTFAAAHDLQEPLRTIRMYAELLRLDDVERSRTKLDFIINAADRMQQLLHELMGYVEVVKRPPDEPAYADATEACRVALQNLEQMATAAGASIQVAALPVVPVDRAHLARIFQNLISNAIKYRAPERQLEIRIWAEPRGDQWLFAVADNGPGIAPAYQSMIFEAFKRAHTANIPGTGLGLALCRRILELYGGSIWVESERDNGATFYFELPGERKSVNPQIGLH